MMKKGLILLCYLLFSNASADMGAIVPVEGVTLNEPGQKAIIVHDGFEQILIISTDLNITKSSPVLRFIPLPSEPTVTLAPEDCFKELEKLIKKYKIHYVIRFKGMDKIDKAVEVVFHKKIGAHDITVVKVEDPIYFREWVNGYFKRKNLPYKESYEKIETLVANYVKRGIRYFVFDLVTLEEGLSSVSPIAYRFESKNLYYPLEISSVFGGSGVIQIFVFSEYASSFIKPQGDEKYFQESQTVVLDTDEVLKISPQIKELLGKRCILKVFKYEGPIEFKGDIWEPMPTGEMLIKAEVIK